MGVRSCRVTVQDLEGYPYIAEALVQLPGDAVIDGELAAPQVQRLVARMSLSKAEANPACSLGYDPLPSPGSANHEYGDPTQDQV